MKTFWILWNPEGKTPPTVKFTDYEAAKKTAETMMERIGVGTMYVLKAEAGCSVSMKMKWDKADGQSR